MLGTTLVSAVDRRSLVSSAATSQTGTLTVVGTLTSVQVSPPRLAVALGGDANVKARTTFTGSALLFSYTSRVWWSRSLGAARRRRRDGGRRARGSGGAPRRPGPLYLSLET